MDNTVYVFGHKNPDTDSICSAICYAELKRLLGVKKAQAFRLGELTKETQFVLDYFKFEAPELLKDVKPQIKDLQIYRPLAISKEEPIKRVWEQLKRTDGNKIVSIIDNDGFLEGLISVGDIAEVYMTNSNENILKDSKIFFRNLIDVVDGEILCGGYPSRIIEGGIYLVNTLDEDTYLNYKDIIVVNNQNDFNKYATQTQCGVIIITDNIKPNIPEGCYKCIVKVPYNYMKTISILFQSLSVEAIMKTEKIELFVEDNYVSDAAEFMRTSAYRNFPVLDGEGKFVGIISRRHLLGVNRKKCILIDHNERGQSVAGLADAQIVEIIDHHRVADIQTSDPLYIRSEPVGCTATIVYKAYCENKIFPRKEISGLLLSAILSDTLKFTSPTCTEDDRKAAKELAILAEVDLEEYSFEMLAAGTAITEFSAEELLQMDRKEFVFDRYKISITQMNTMSLRSLTSIKQDIMEAMKKLADSHGYDLVIFMITDLILSGSEIISYGRKKDLVKKAFKMDDNEDIKFLPGVVSRKKQVVPNLISASKM